MGYLLSLLVCISPSVPTSYTTEETRFGLNGFVQDLRHVIPQRVESEDMRRRPVEEKPIVTV
jgi:hypothetical protein